MRILLTGGHGFIGARLTALFAEELGLRFRPAEVVLRDTLRWLLEAGQLRAEKALALASS